MALPAYFPRPVTVLALVLSVSPLSLDAAISFTVSGRVYTYYDYVNSTMVCNNDLDCGYSYSMTFTFDNTVNGVSEPYLLWDIPYYPYLHTSYTGSVIHSKSVLYGTAGEIIETMEVDLDDFDPNNLADYNQTDVYEDLTPFYYDFLRWTAYKGYATSEYNYNGVGFYMTPGTIAKYDNGYPIPPVDYSFHSPSAAGSVSYDLVKNQFYYYNGKIDQIGIDPISECRDSARNHGQLIKCINSVTNGWKKAGEISGAEKGGITSENARKK